MEEMHDHENCLYCDEKNSELARLRKTIELYGAATKAAYGTLTGQDIGQINCPPYCALEDAAVDLRDDCNALAAACRLAEKHLSQDCPDRYNGNGGQLVSVLSSIRAALDAGKGER